MVKDDDDDDEDADEENDADEEKEENEEEEDDDDDEDEDDEDDDNDDDDDDVTNMSFWLRVYMCMHTMCIALFTALASEASQCVVCSTSLRKMTYDPTALWR